MAELARYAIWFATRILHSIMLALYEAYITLAADILQQSHSLEDFSNSNCNRIL